MFGFSDDDVDGAVTSLPSLAAPTNDDGDDAGCVVTGGTSTPSSFSCADGSRVSAVRSSERAAGSTELVAELTVTVV
jgi:hypothetical protein